MATGSPELRTIANNLPVWAIAATAINIDHAPTRNRVNWVTPA